MDRLLAEWAAARPELDLTPVASVARIERAGRLLERTIASTLAEMGLTRGGFAVLSALRRQVPDHRLRPADLLRGLLSTTGAMTNRIDRLEEAGLVRRVPDPADRRSKLIELTPAGLELIDRAVIAHLENERALLAALSPTDQRTLATLLRKLLVSIGDQYDHDQTSKVKGATASSAALGRDGGGTRSP